MKRQQPSDQVQRSVRATDEEIQAMLDRLDAASRHPRSSMRSRERFPYRVQSCTIRLEATGAPVTSPFLAPTRNISAGGMSFLHGGFVHAGVRCTAQLVTTDGRWIEVAGRVVRCRYVENWIHEINVQFDAEIRPADFCKAALRIRVLLLEPDDQDAGLTTHQLVTLHCETDRVKNAADAARKIADVHYHVIFLDTDSPDLDTTAIIRGMREQGYTGLVVAMTSSPTPVHRERCLLGGCCEYIVKPPSPERFKRLLDRLRQAPPTSSLLADQATAGVVTAFLEEIPARVRQLEETADAEQFDQLAGIVRKLHEEAGSFGFETVAETAQAVGRILDGGAAAISKVKNELEDLIGVCMLARRAATADHSGATPRARSGPAGDASVGDAAPG